MPETDDATATRAEAIASQVVNLKETEVLVLRLPPDMDTADGVFEQFRRDLRSLLPEGVGQIRAIVLRHDMQLEDYDGKALARVGLSSRDSPPYKQPETLFDSGPLRSAALAGWASAFGDRERADSEVHVAEEALRVEIAKGTDPLKITHSSPPVRPRGAGGPF